jgi:hypothetical protein
MIRHRLHFFTHIAEPIQDSERLIASESFYFRPQLEITMRKLLFMAIAVCALAVASFAQKADYSGTWKLDLEKSTFSGPARIESMTLTVAQTDKDIKVDTVTKRAAPPADAPGGGAPGGGAGRGGRGGGDASVTYALDGKETKVEVDTPRGKVPVNYKGSAETDGSLKLSTSRTVNGPQGEVTMTTKETWKLSADGKTLTVDRESTSPRGHQTSTLVFAKA